MASEFSAKSALFEASERSLSIKGIIAVDVDCSGSEGVGNLEDVVHVPGDDSSSESIVAVVGSLDDLVHILELHEAHDRAKDLLLGNGHVVGHISEDGGLDEVSFLSVALSSQEQLGSLLLSSLHISQDLVHLFFINLGSLLGLLIEGISDHSSRGALGGSLNKLIINLLVNKDSASSDAALALVEEKGKLSLLNGQFHVSVVHNNVRRFATELESDSLQS